MKYGDIFITQNSYYGVITYNEKSGELEAVINTDSWKRVESIDYTKKAKIEPLGNISEAGLTPYDFIDISLIINRRKDKK